MRVLEKLSQNAKYAIKNAYEIAQNTSSKEVLVKHFFVALLQGKGFMSSQVLENFGIDFTLIVQKVMSSSPSVIERKMIPVLSVEAKGVVQKAYQISRELSHVYVGTEHLLLAIFTVKGNPFISELEKFGLNYQSVKEKTLSVASYPPGLFVYVGKDNQIPSHEEDGLLLDDLGRNLTELAYKGKLMPVVGREKEIDKMINILSRKTKNNPIIVGEAGVGKTALVEGLAIRIAKGAVPPSLLNKRIYSVNTASIVAGSKVRGELEEKVLEIMDEAAADPDIILFIDEIHTILGAGAASGGSLDIADILKPALANGELRCIGATTVGSYQNIFEEDTALSRRFQPVNLEELSVRETVKVLKKIKKVFGEYHGVKVDDEALLAAAQLSDRYIYERFLPDKAVDLIDEACAREKLAFEGKLPNTTKIQKNLYKVLEKKEMALDKGDYEKAIDLRNLEDSIKKELSETRDEIRKIQKGTNKVVTADDIRGIISEWTGVPVKNLTQDDAAAIKQIDKILARFIVGQKEAIEKVSNALKRARIGISDVNRPMASYLFLGPTGVGKTELSRVIARELFGSEKNLIQIDMSEMMEPHSVSKIIGAPPGYVGYQEGGQLTDKIRRRPYAVVLFDEIEKAHPDVLNILLQILEYGQVTDSRGRVASFKNAIVILTSNIGAESITDNSVLGFDIDISDKKEEEMEMAYEEMKTILMEELKAELRPEFLNRLDDVIIFRSLSSEDAVEIVKILVSDLQKRIKSQGYRLNLTGKVYQFVADKGFDKEYGARPLRRYLQDEIESLVADYILDNQRSEGDKTLKEIKIRVKDGKLKIIN